MKTARSDIGLGLPMSNRALALQIGGRAPPLGVSSGPGPLRIPVGHEPRGPVVSRDGRSDARVGRRDAPRLDRRGDDVAIRHLRDRGEARGRATRRVEARGAGAPDAPGARGEKKRRFRAFARRRRRRRRPGRNGEVSRRDDREGHRERHRTTFDDEGTRERSSYYAYYAYEKRDS